MTSSRLVFLLVVAAVFTGTSARAGHEMPFYPSFYPQEIKVEFLEPDAAARLLRKSAVQAYVGGDPFARATVPPHVTYAESLGSYVVLTFSPSWLAGGDGGRRCAAAAPVLRALAGARGDYVFHPYPVTPFHDTYLEHFDLADSARRRYETSKEPPAGERRLRVHARGSLARTLTAAGWRVSEGAGDVTLEAIEVRALLGPKVTLTNGWSGPPWRKEGWYQAYLLSAGHLAGAAERGAAEETVVRLTAGEDGATERANLERRLVAHLTRGCERLVVGYTVRREPLSAEYSEGVENVGHDAQDGLDSAIFLRTVKLKDFPWNGWLRLGVASRPAAAWNPVAGFGDETGRLIWAAVGDPAFLPSPQGDGWVANRVRPTTTVAPGTAVEIPGDALAPDRASGALAPVGPGATARARIGYRVLASAFHDGTKMTPADLLYPFVFAQRWGVKGASGSRYDPAVDRATALVRQALAAIKVVRADVKITDYGETQLMYDVPQVDVYLKQGAARHTAAIAPPWATVPWQLIVLMEEAVSRGLAAFSEEEARRRGVPWLDLVRDRKVGASLAALLATFERQAFVPDGLRGLVTTDQARQRWAALRRFHRTHGHFLVTNGPYRLATWSGPAVVLSVFRDLTYPVGIGTFDRYVLPRRAYVAKAERRGTRIEIEAEVDQVTKFERSYRIGREPYRPEPSGQGERDSLAVHYAVVGAGDEVLGAGLATTLEGGRLVVDLGGHLKPGAYRVSLALVLNDNFVNPEVKVVPIRVTD